MKKIAYFIDSLDSGGAEDIVIELCKKVKYYGIRPEIFHFGNQYILKQSQKYKIQNKIVPGFKYYKSFKSLPLFFILFKNFLIKNRIDLLHSHLFGAVTGACIPTFFAKIPHIGTFHDIYTFEQKKIRIFMVWYAKLLNTRLVTVSKNIKDYLIKVGKLPKNSIQTIPNGIEVSKYKKLLNVDYKKDIGINKDDIVLISIGRLISLKGFDILIEAFSQIYNKSHLKLLIVGDGQHKNFLNNLINRKNLSESIKLLGFRNDIPQLLNLADCFILCSKSEGLSVSILEAMASGLPIIATNVGGNSELVKDGINGYLIEPNNSHILANKIMDLINDYDKLKKFGRASLYFVKKNYSLDRMVERYVDNYFKMI
ncbi:MAG: glycosyltransferase [Promethearchaeota archaeon]